MGAYASLAFDATGATYIAYADQTDNDLVLTTQATGTAWDRHVIAADGAYGGFARLAIAQSTAYVTTYLRDNPSGARDDSRLVLFPVDLGALP